MISRPSLAAALVAGVLAGCSPPGPAGPVGAPPQVSTVWLAEHLDDADLVVLDVRPDRRLFDAGHLPGAVHLAVPGRSASPGTGTSLPPALVREVLRELGIREQVHVVVYSSGAAGAAGVARLLREAGQSRVSVLEGGLRRWTREGRPTTSRPTSSRA